MIQVIYNEGQGFTEVRKTYSTLQEAIQCEGVEIAHAHIYKNKTRIQ